MTLRLVAIVAPMLLAMGISTWRSWRGDRLFLVVLLCLVVVWSRVDAEFEGPKILEIADGHSLVLADLVGVLFGVVGVTGFVIDRLGGERTATG